ncbi:hypothetical protein L249_8796 [Ophiocordyceps polyrhachis-furcata BCC 54312]|uniref:PAC domain-containing protein n=1 Tax=Ophiocordyceps polyrhachis-furcata BCC 54312 TaxID=1330021 RepID=A0A367L1Z6_9HYPO|nr:hypothetical protein L249_8796 [Ophiocordyceps polyrhachis-furcata BCC 54312]
MSRSASAAAFQPLSPVPRFEPLVEPEMVSRMANGRAGSDVSFDDVDLAVKPLPPPPLTPPCRDGESELPPLQTANGEPEGLDPVDGDDGSFDLVMPATTNGSGGDGQGRVHELELRSDLLFSRRHLRAIFDDPTHLHRFTSFLYQYRPESVPLLTYYLEALKALRAIEYSNAVLRRLEPPPDIGLTEDWFRTGPTSNEALQAKADAAFELLTREDLPMFVTHVWIHTVTMSIRHRIRGTLPHASEGLAEVFCLTDPSRHDNPIVFMSDEFNRTTQYGVDYVIGRNCRFLQGPHTNPFSISRIRHRLEAGLEHYETFLNYRRDGSPFMNLVMLAPLYDSRGTIRYFIGAQVDVSGLVRACYGLGALKKLVDEDQQAREAPPSPPRSTDEFTQLAEILGPRELDIVREHGGDMYRPPPRDGPIPTGPQERRDSVRRPDADAPPPGDAGNGASRHRVVLRDPESPNTDGVPYEAAAQLSSGPPSSAAMLSVQHNGRLTGVYENYLLVRPYPSLRILFTSPSMRMPGILQSPLLDRIGGSARIRQQFVQALSQGQGVTAKVKWLTRLASHGSRPPRKKMHYNHPLEAHLDAGDDTDTLGELEPVGRSRWLHCTPLLGSNGKVGVWMVVIVDDELDAIGRHGGHPRPGTAISETSDDDQIHGFMPEGRPMVRPRKSSETLGTQPTMTSKDQDPSAIEPIHQKSPHAVKVKNGQRRRGRRSSSNSPARPLPFYGHSSFAGIPSRGSTPFRSENGRQSPHHGEDVVGGGGSGPPSIREGRTETPMPSWPLPPFMSPTTRKKREHQIYVPPSIPETSYERGVIRGREDGETSSTGSRGSAFTVRIEEED